jgi:hypothetical protein
MKTMTRTMRPPTATAAVPALSASADQARRRELVALLSRPMRMKRIQTLLIVATISSVCTGCWGLSPGGSEPTGTNPAVRTIRLKPGNYTLHLGGRINVGDKIACVTDSGAAAGGGFVPKPGHGVSSSTGFSVEVLSSGLVKVTCPANPGNA